MSLANGQYSLQSIVTRDTNAQLEAIDMKMYDSLNVDIIDMIEQSNNIITNYNQKSEKELVKVAKKYSSKGDEYYDPADMLESMRAFYYASVDVYKKLCNLIERNINALGRQTDKTFKCDMIQKNINGETVQVPVISDDNYLLIYQIIAEY